MANPNVCVLTAEGINCEAEMAHAFDVAGAEPEIVHINQLKSGDRDLGRYAILAFPGGFSYGDAISSGRVLANEQIAFLSDQLQEFTNEHNPKPVIGVCNGFQVLVKMGLLPDRTLGTQSATLADNEINRFECRWIELGIGQTACKFVQPKNYPFTQIPVQTAHGEGRFFAHDDDIHRITDNHQVVFRYTMPDGRPAESYPDNPSGSLENIAGVCDSTGTILGLMPHPERSVSAFHPYRPKTPLARAAANQLFTNIVQYARES